MSPTAGSGAALIGGRVGQVPLACSPAGSLFPLPEPDSPGCLRREEPRGEDPCWLSSVGRAESGVLFLSPIRGNPRPDGVAYGILLVAIFCRDRLNV